VENVTILKRLLVRREERSEKREKEGERKREKESEEENGGGGGNFPLRRGRETLRHRWTDQAEGEVSWREASSGTRGSSPVFLAEE
jgi:hypothetical protein